MKSGNWGSENLNNSPKVILAVVKMGFKPSEEHSPNPLEAASAQVVFILFLFQPPDVTVEICFFLVTLEVGKRTLPALYQSVGVRGDSLWQRTPRKSNFRPCRDPIPCLWSGTSVVAAPTSCIFHLPSPPPLPSTPSPTINENQKEGEWGLESVIPFLFIGLHRRTRGKECGLYPEARSKALIGGWVLAGLGLWPPVP